jgi:hypothetical protein
VLIPRLRCFGSRGGEGGVAAEWSCAPRGAPDPLGVPVRHAMQHGADDGSGFHTGKGGIEAEVHPAAEGDMVVRPSDEETPVSDRYDGPQTVRAGPRSDPDGDRADDVEGAPRLQPASPALPADASPCSTVLPKMVRLPPVAWVISTRRG